MSRRLLISFCVAFLTSFNACRSPEAPAPESGIQQEISGLVEEATREVGSQRYDTAMEKALEALDLSRQGGALTLMHCRYRHHVQPGCGRMGESPPG